MPCIHGAQRTRVLKGYANSHSVYGVLAKLMNVGMKGWLVWWIWTDSHLSVYGFFKLSTAKWNRPTDDWCFKCIGFEHDFNLLLLG